MTATWTWTQVTLKTWELTSGMTDGCRKLRLLRTLDHTVACGWDRSLYSKPTIHQAGEFSPHQKCTNLLREHLLFAEAHWPTLTSNQSRLGRRELLDPHRWTCRFNQIHRQHLVPWCRFSSNLDHAVSWSESKSRYVIMQCGFCGFFRQSRTESASDGFVPLWKHRFGCRDWTGFAITRRLGWRDERLCNSSHQSRFRWAPATSFSYFLFCGSVFLSFIISTNAQNAGKPFVYKYKHVITRFPYLYLIWLKATN